MHRCLRRLLLHERGDSSGPRMSSRREMRHVDRTFSACASVRFIATRWCAHARELSLEVVDGVVRRRRLMRCDVEGGGRAGG